MTLIHVPRPPKSAMNPNRPVSSLLKTQIEHLQRAETRLPHPYQAGIYINAIKTEGEAAKYIRAVTEAIHDAHTEASEQRTHPVARRKRTIEIAAVGDLTGLRKTGRKSPAKKSRRNAPKKK